MSSIGLCMVVKDEVEIIGRCLESVRYHINHWTVCDTGSTDGTQVRVGELLDGIPGELYQDEWRDFGHNRSLGLLHARGTADYLLMLDADMVLVAADRPELTADAYDLRIEDGTDFSYQLPALVKGDLDWKFEGVTHEHLTGNGYPEVPAVLLTDWYLLHLTDGSRRPMKLADDLLLLEAEVKRDPSNARSWFYFAQTMRDLGLNAEAAAAYEHRITMGGWAEEVWYAHYQKGVCQLRQGLWEEGRATLLAAYLRDTTRAEPLYAIAKSMLPREGALFLERYCYGGQPHD